ncbi:hypothetical protein PC116_g31447 [Phytophthora cactorum]|nr:hypothetical protein PC116_g31447 [Phytophthora cactorum]
MTSLSAALGILAAGVLVQAYSGSSTSDYERLIKREVPGQAQVIDWKSFNVLPTVSPPSVANASTVKHAPIFIIP